MAFLRDLPFLSSPSLPEETGLKPPRLMWQLLQHPVGIWVVLEVLEGGSRAMWDGEGQQQGTITMTF